MVVVQAQTQLLQAGVAPTADESGLGSAVETEDVESGRRCRRRYPSHSSPRLRCVEGS